MSLQEIIAKGIYDEAKKLAERHQRYHNHLELAHQQSARRINAPPPKLVQKPASWSADKKFNPFYVLHHLEPISRSIARALQRGTYAPRAPFERQVPKKDGAFRTIHEFQIPDAAVSNYFYRKLLSKNRHRFSPYAYAYRDDRNVHFAIQDVSVDLRRYPRLFIAEYDFSDFFGSIDHAFLRRQFDENGFFITQSERQVVESFLALRSRGVPQGTSISLFLANLCCWKLDRDLSDFGLKFARYADDTVIWAPDYGRICKAVEVIDAFSREVGVMINPRKSEGISILQKQGFKSEFARTKQSVSFLGYKLSVEAVSIKDSALIRIKRHIAYLLYRELIQPLRGTALRAVTIPANNRDPALLSALSHVRRYLYGGLSEDVLRAYLAGAYDRVVFEGVMSFYPLINDEPQLRELDGWLVRTLHGCLRVRARLLAGWGHNCNMQFPFNVSREELPEECRRRTFRGKRILEIPSFLRIYRAIQKRLTASGIEATMNHLGIRHHSSES